MELFFWDTLMELLKLKFLELEGEFDLAELLNWFFLTIATRSAIISQPKTIPNTNKYGKEIIKTNF